MNTNIDSLTIAEARSISALFSAQSVAHPYKIGEAYFIRTVTHHYTGRLLAVFPTELVLDRAAWIADDGRFHQAVTKSEFAEVEPYAPNTEVIIGRGAILDASIIGILPTAQK